MKMKVPEIVSSRMNPISTPLRKPMKISSTATTMATASMRLTMKPLIAVVTASDCREMMPNSTPSGIWGSSSRTRRSNASPMVTTLPPLTVDTPKPIPTSPS